MQRRRKWTEALSPQSLLLHAHCAPSRITTRTVIESVKSIREKHGEQWNDHAPVQEQVAQIRANERPTAHSQPDRVTDF